MINAVLSDNKSHQELENLRSQAFSTAAHDIVKALNIKRNEKVVIVHDGFPESNPLVAELIKVLDPLNASVALWERNIERTARNLMSEDPFKIGNEGAELDRLKNLYEWTDHSIFARSPANPLALADVPSEIKDPYVKYNSAIDQIRIAKSWMIVFTPTEFEAKKEGLEFAEYEKIIYKSWLQPWDVIKLAQSKLIEKLNAGKTLRFYSESPELGSKYKTDLTLSIDGMTFINSTINRNYPGAEVFSAPVRNSVNGTLYAPGKFLRDSSILEDLFFEFKDGQIVHAEARVGQDVLDRLLNSEPGARYMGEVAMGNNPALTRQFLNGLYAEKQAASFHIAIGRSYMITNYFGQEVCVDNGNRAAFHWDIAKSLLPEAGGGLIELDGEVIQVDGQWLDPELSALSACG